MSVCVVALMCGDGYLVMYRYMCESSFINAIGWSVIGFFFVLVMVLRLSSRSLEGQRAV